MSEGNLSGFIESSQAPGNPGKLNGKVADTEIPHIPNIIDDRRLNAVDNSRWSDANLSRGPAFHVEAPNVGNEQSFFNVKPSDSDLVVLEPDSDSGTQNDFLTSNESSLDHSLPGQIFDGYSYPVEYTNCSSFYESVIETEPYALHGTDTSSLISGAGGFHSVPHVEISRGSSWPTPTYQPMPTNVFKPRTPQYAQANYQRGAPRGNQYVQPSSHYGGPAQSFGAQLLYQQHGNFGGGYAPQNYPRQPKFSNAMLRPPAAPSQQFTDFMAGKSSRSAMHMPNAPSAMADSTIIYQVQFKMAVKHYILGNYVQSAVDVGDFVVVEADRGEDLGIVVELIPMKRFIEMRYMARPSTDEDENSIGRILRVASPYERQQLPDKHQEEASVVELCRELAHNTYMLQMNVLDAEYQFDRHKLTVYYTSLQRIDFRELVRDLFSAYKARIWMRKLNPHHTFVPKQFALMALASGVQFTPER